MRKNGIIPRTSQSIPGSQAGEFAVEGTHCTFQAIAEVDTNVFASCADGVFTLEIWENWKTEE